jgi:hypothetical protein
METSENSEPRTPGREDVADAQRRCDTTNQTSSMEKEDNEVMSEEMDRLLSPENESSTEKESKVLNFIEDGEKRDEKAVDTDENISSRLNVLDNSITAEFENAVSIAERSEGSPRDVSWKKKEIIEADVLNTKESKDCGTFLSNLKDLETSAVNTQGINERNCKSSTVGKFIV